MPRRPTAAGVVTFELPPGTDFVRLDTRGRPPGYALFSFENAAKLSGLTVKAIRDACHEGRLDVTTIKGKPHVRLGDLDALCTPDTSHAPQSTH
jgi:hypothetical protein